MADGRYLTPNQFARQRQISPSKVLQWIHAGRLRAVNYAAGELGQRPRWRIPPDAIAEFEGKRLAVKPKATTKRKKRPIKEWV